MLTHHNFTIFGSADSIVADLISQANEFCKAQSGSDAYLLNSDTSDAVSGALNDYGSLRRVGRGATGTIYFQCTPPRHVESADDRGAKLDNLAKLKKQLDSGAITQQEYEAQKKQVLGD